MTTPLLTLQIERNELLAMQLLASTDSSRYILNGVHFEIDGEIATLVATNGVMLCALRTGTAQDGQLKEFTVNVSCARLLKPTKTHGNKVQIEVFEKEVSFKLNGIKIVGERIEGNFPAWKGVVPTTPFCHGQYSFNAGLVQTLFKVSHLLSPGKGSQVNLHPHADKDGIFSAVSPYSVLFPSCDRFYGVLMPMRASEQAVPSWALPEKKP